MQKHLILAISVHWKRNPKQQAELSLKICSHFSDQVWHKVTICIPLSNYNNWRNTEKHFTVDRFYFHGRVILYEWSILNSVQQLINSQGWKQTEDFFAVATIHMLWESSFLSVNSFIYTTSTIVACQLQGILQGILTEHRHKWIHAFPKNISSMSKHVTAC